MSKLIDPGPGEVSDRLTILALKVLFGEQAGHPVDHFKAEQTALLSKVRSRTLNGVWFPRVLDLAAVNAALWHAEDDLRAYRRVLVKYTPEEQLSIVELAFRIQDLNDQRAALIERINKDTGDHTGTEKLLVTVGGAYTGKGE